MTISPFCDDAPPPFDDGVSSPFDADSLVISAYLSDVTASLHMHLVLASSGRIEGATPREWWLAAAGFYADHSLPSATHACALIAMRVATEPPS